MHWMQLDFTSSECGRKCLCGAVKSVERGRSPPSAVRCECVKTEAVKWTRDSPICTFFLDVLGAQRLPLSSVTYTIA